MHLLIVEDDRSIAENLYDYLESRGHQCDYARTLREAQLRLAGHPSSGGFDALLLDRSLPDGDGIELIHHLRMTGMTLPILVLTARDALEDKLSAFDTGADDYLAKPFALKEVEARLIALQRRHHPLPTQAPLTIGRLCYDHAARQFLLDGHPIALPPKALTLLHTMAPHPERLFSRRELELAAWGQEQSTSDNLRSVLLILRKSIAGTGVEIRNVHTLGYKLTLA